jgi:outer membrane protein
VLNAQVQVNTIESALAKASSSILNASDGLYLLMGIEADDDKLKVDSLQQKVIPSFDTQLSISRSDIMALNKALDASDMMYKSSKMAFLPRINAFGSYGWNDAKIFKFNADSYMVGINVSWNIFSGNQNRSKLKSAQFQRDKIKEDLNRHIKESRVELSKTKRDLNVSQIEINKQEASVDQADEALRILTNRHREGLENTTDLLMAQAQLSKQQLQLIQAVMSYNITEAYLKFLSE